MLKANACVEDLVQQNENLQDQVLKANKREEDLTALHKQSQEIWDAELQALTEQLAAKMKQTKVKSLQQTSLMFITVQ